MIHQGAEKKDKKAFQESIDQMPYKANTCGFIVLS